MSSSLPPLSSAPPDKSLPPPPVAKKTDPTIDATKKVAEPVIQKPSVTPKPPVRERKVKSFSIGKVWERFCRLFKNALKSSDATTFETSLAPFVTEVTPVKRFDPLDLWPKSPVTSKAPVKTNSPPVVRETPAKFRNELPGSLNDLAKALNRAKATAKPQGAYKPKPQVNITGNNCYMNSSLQLLQNSRMQYDEACKELIKQDLTIRPNETLKEFEKRVLHTWAPINDADDVDLVQLRGEIQTLEAELAEVGIGPLETRDIKERLGVCRFKLNAIENQDIAKYNDKVLFKLSFLLLLQAKAYGSSTQVTEALKKHHQAVFMLDDPYMSFDERRHQLDSALYHNLWHETLGFASYLTTFKDAIQDNGEAYISDHAAVEKSPIIKFNIRNEKGVNAKSLLEGIDRYFTDSIQNSTEKQRLEESLAAKRKELEDTPALNLVKCNNLKAEIKNLEMAYVNIAGGEVKRPNGTVGVVSAESWKPREDEALTFDDWTNNRLFIDPPPPFLEIALDRFYADRNGVNQKKIADKLPLDRDADGKATGDFTDPLDLSKYFAPEVIQEDGAKYELIGVSQHLGSGINGGHYVAYVKSGDQWFYTSDSTVKACKIAEVPFGNASVLSFRRI